MERIQDEHKSKDIRLQKHDRQYRKQHFGATLIGKKQVKCIWSWSSEGKFGLMEKIDWTEEPQRIQVNKQRHQNNKNVVKKVIRWLK
jgi:hypothetical protein